MASSREKDGKGPERTRSLTYNTVLVLQALAGSCEYGLEVIQLTGLSSGTVYPILRRLESEGLVEALWEDEEEARDEGRPARRYYRVTGAGGRALERARRELVARQEALGLEAGGGTG